MRNRSPEERLAANEVIFREYNKKVLELAKKTTGNSKEHNQYIQFYCECSSPFCMENIKIDSEAYESAHKSPKRFTIKTGHEQPEIEKVIEDHDDYSLVEKYKVPPTPDRALPK